MRVAVTGAGGRLGSALMRALPARGCPEVIGWGRADVDLDHPGAELTALRDARPDVVIHAAAWTDVDGCARDPDLALRRNAEASEVLALECVDLGISLVLVSTNEVFDGERTDAVGYAPTDTPAPRNAYGRSKLAAEVAVRAAFEEAHGRAGGPAAGVVRTAWLFGGEKPDFPAKIIAAARDAAARGATFRVVGDETGTPTYVPDVADGIARLVVHGTATLGGIHHVVNSGRATRAEWARDILGRAGIDLAVEEMRLDNFERPSRPPRWGVLEATTLPGGALRPWTHAMADWADARAVGAS